MVETSRLTVIEFFQESPVVVQLPQKLFGGLGGSSLLRFSAFFLLLLLVHLCRLGVMAYLLLFLLLLFTKPHHKYTC